MTRLGLASSTVRQSVALSVTYAEEHGADDETRTRDIDLGKVALYQLSYIRTPARRSTGQSIPSLSREV